MRQDHQQQQEASDGWYMAGCLFGLFGWLIALATDKGDGRDKKALTGCFLWVILAIGLLVLFGI